MGRDISMFHAVCIPPAMRLFPRDYNDLFNDREN